MYGDDCCAKAVSEKLCRRAKIRFKLSPVYGSLRSGFSYRGADDGGGRVLRLKICPCIYADIPRKRDHRRRFYGDMRDAADKKAAEKTYEKYNR